MDEILSAVSSYGSFFLTVVVIVTIVFILSATILFWIFSKRGFTGITERGPRWFKILSLSGALLTALVIGIVVGIQVGVVQTGLKAIDDVGLTIVNHGLELTGQSLGINSLEQNVDIGMARSALAKLGSLQLVDSGGIEAMIVNGTFENLRKPLLEKAEMLIDRLTPEDRISLAEIASTTWAEVRSSIESASRSVVLSKIVMGYVWLLIFAAGALLLTRVIKNATAKSSAGLNKIKTRMAQ